MKFRGNGVQLELCFDILISIFGKDAKIADIEKRVATFRRQAA